MIDSKMTDEPVDRLTRLCDVMLKALHADPEYDEDITAILCLDTGTRGGIVHEGYDDEHKVVVDLLMHATAIAQANGKEIRVIVPERN